MASIEIRLSAKFASLYDDEGFINLATGLTKLSGLETRVNLGSKVIVFNVPEDKHVEDLQLFSQKL